jgi:hypothetical protein
MNCAVCSAVSGARNSCSRLGWAVIKQCAANARHNCSSVKGSPFATTVTDQRTLTQSNCGETSHFRLDHYRTSAYLFRRRPLDIRPYSSYLTILAPVKDVARRHTVSWERGRCPRAGLQPAPGRLGYQPPGSMTGVGGASLDWDRRRRVTPVQTKSQEAWPEAEPLG